MIRECENHAGSMTRFGSPGSGRRPRCVASSATPSRGSCGSCAGGKNGLWVVWTEAANLLRPQDPSGARPLLRRHPGVPGDRDPARALPELRRREAREVALVGQQPLLHEAVRILRRPPLSVRDGPGCGARTPPRLEDGQGAGDGVHARATPTGRDTWPEGDRRRRTLRRQGAQLPHHRQRPGPRSADLVRRYGPIREEHGPLLPVAGAAEMQGNPPGRDGHVEAVPQLHAQGGERAPSRHPLPCVLQTIRSAPTGPRHDHRAGSSR
jgi:hypothetical protein